jgi:hypothetical protein
MINPDNVKKKKSVNVDKSIEKICIKTKYICTLFAVLIIECAAVSFYVWCFFGFNLKVPSPEYIIYNNTIHECVEDEPCLIIVTIPYLTAGGLSILLISLAYTIIMSDCRLKYIGINLNLYLGLTYILLIFLTIFIHLIGSLMFYIINPNEYKYYPFISWITMIFGSIPIGCSILIFIIINWSKQILYCICGPCLVIEETYVEIV